MGNSSLSMPNVRCFDPNLSRNSVTPEYWEIHSISNAYSNNALGTAIVMLLFFVVGVPGNVLVIVSIIKEKLYKQATHTLLLNLAISDLLVCLLFMPFVIVTGFAGEFIFGSTDYVRCQFCQFEAVFTALTVFSVSMLAAITMDRFIFIKFPLRYDKVVKVRAVVIFVVIIWLVSIFESLLPIIGFGEISFSFSVTGCVINLFGEGKYTMNIYYMFFLLVLNLIPVGLVFVFNSWLACIVGKQIRVVYSTRWTIGNKEELKKYNQGLRKQIHRKKSKKQLVLVRVFGAILLSNIIVWMPLVFHTIVTQIVDPNMVPLGNYSFVGITFVMHSVLHPLIEGWMIPEIKSSIKTFLGVSFLQKQLKKLREQRIRKESVAISFDLPIQDRVDEEEGKCHGCCELCSVAMAMYSTSESSDSAPTTL